MLSNALLSKLVFCAMIKLPQKVKFERRQIMNQVVKTVGNNLSTYTSSVGEFTQDFLSAIPLALASPILVYQKTKAQAKLLEITVEARRAERMEILRTVQILAKYNQLSDELFVLLMAAYNTQSY